MRRDRRRAITLVVLVPVCALATALTPMGFRLWSYIGSSMALSKQTRIDEWRPAYPTGPFEIAFWVLAVGFVALLIRRGRRLAKASWADVVSVAAALVVLPLAARAVRNVAAVPAAGDPGGEPAARSGLCGAPRAASPAGAAGRPRSDRRRPPAAQPALLAAFTAHRARAASSAAWAAPHPRLGWRPLGEAAIEAVRGCPAPVYNRYYDGGFLIWFVPEQRVFVDSRQDPYPLPFLLDQVAIEEGAPTIRVFDRYGMRCAFLPVGAALGARLGADGWQTRYRDERWIVLVAP